MLEMPVLRDDGAQEPVEPLGLGDQLGEEQAHVPLDQHFADVEDDSLDRRLNWRYFMDGRHDKTPADGGGLMHATKPSAC
jgi:hypothetical protein